jgi:hypothetical protein
MFALEVDVFNDINLIHLLEEYYSLESTLRRIFKDEIFYRDPYSFGRDSYDLELEFESFVKEDAKYYILTVDRDTNELEYFTEYTIYDFRIYSKNKYYIYKDEIVHDCHDTFAWVEKIHKIIDEHSSCYINEYYIGKFKNFKHLIDKSNSDPKCDECRRK